MLNLKKTAVAVLALGSSAVFAGTMGPVCTPGNVTVPCERNAWEVGGYALYAQPTTAATGLLVDNGLIRNDADNWNWGFILEAGYHYGTGNDVNVNWTRLDRSTTAAFPVITGFERVKSNWDQVNVEFGQVVDFSATNSVRFHGGVQYSRLDMAHASLATDVATTVFAAGHQTQYNGFGPRAGVDMNYGFGNGFGIYAKGAGSLLVGTSSANDVVAFDANTDGTVDTFGRFGSRTNVVPEFDAKLGANYTYAMAQGDLTLDAGYMWVDYLGSQMELTRGLGYADNHNVAFNGVYFGLKYVGNV